MTIQAMNFGRDTLLDVFDIESTAWKQRSYRGEVALGFGLGKPAHTNQYGEIDLVAVMLTVAIGFVLKIDMGQAAEIVRDYWKEWLSGVADAERLKRGTPYSERPCFFIIADTDSREKIDVMVGPCEKTIKDISGDKTATSIPIDAVVSKVRMLAKKAGLTLPSKLTPGPAVSVEFKRWITDIESYRRFANMRDDGRKAKKQDSPARKRLLPAE